MNKHNLLCSDCAAKAGLKLSTIAIPLQEWRMFWVLKYKDLLKYVDKGCIVCHNNSEDLIVDCVCNVEVME